MTNAKSYQQVQGLLLNSVTPLTLADRRLFNYLLHDALDHLSHQKEFVISLSALEGVYGAGRAPLYRLKDSLRRLLRTLVEFSLPSEEWVITSLLQQANIDSRAQTLTYAYSKPLCCLFATAENLEKCLIQAHFTQKYSNRLYDYLASIYFQNRLTFNVSIEEIRSLLKIEDKKLVNFSDLNRFALKPAIEELNAYASFAVKYHTERKGMKVITIHFELTPKRPIADIYHPKQVIPPKRPRLFIDSPEVEQVYAYLLNADTKERRRYFKLAMARAAKKNVIIEEEWLDRPDLWLQWVQDTTLEN